MYQSLFDGSCQAEIRTPRKKLTVFFSEIKKFTELTAQCQPEKVTLLPDSHFAEISQIASEYGAMRDEFIGDALVIFLVIRTRLVCRKIRCNASTWPLPYRCA